jgi:hypothetical protein
MNEGEEQDEKTLQTERQRIEILKAEISAFMLFGMHCFLASLHSNHLEGDGAADYAPSWRFFCLADSDADSADCKRRVGLYTRPNKKTYVPLLR